MPTDESDIRTARGITVPFEELDFSAIRASGPGGQHVNKTSTAIQLRFDIRASDAFTDTQKRRLLAVRDRRVTLDGQILIRAQQYRSQDKNRRDATDRLIEFIDSGLAPVKPRKKTRPGKAAKEKRLREKAARSKLKSTRKPPDT